MKLGLKTAVFFTQHIVNPVKTFFPKFGRKVKGQYDLQPQIPREGSPPPRSKPKTSLFSRFITKSESSSNEKVTAEDPVLLVKANPLDTPSYYYAQAQQSLREVVESCAKNKPENAVKAFVRLGQNMVDWHIAKPENHTGNKPDADQFGAMTSELMNSDWLPKKPGSTHQISTIVHYNFREIIGCKVQHL